MKKNQIKQKAEELFKLYGVRAVTMDEISAQLGISKKTLYSFFHDKNDLVDEIVKDILDRNVASCRLCKTNATNAVEEILYAGEMLEMVLNGMNPVVLYDLERSYPQSFQRFQDYKYQYLYSLIVENIKWGKEDGLYRDELDADLFVRARLELLTLAFNDQLFPRIKYSLVQIQKQLLDLFLYSMVTPQGLKVIQRSKKESTKNFKPENQ